jgi:outer membrane protein OmpA-like peptidoglycan-associated protein
MYTRRYRDRARRTRAGCAEGGGCPPPDRYGDAIPDARDRCIDANETYNHYTDEDGCPDTIPDDPARFTGTLRDVRFDPGSTRLNREAKRTLRGAAKVLNAANHEFNARERGN